MLERTAVIGAGGWGTALAVLLGLKEIPVNLWVRNDDVFQAIAKTRVNSLYLPGVELPGIVRPVQSLEEAVGKSGLVIMAVPSHAMRETAARIGEHLDPGAVIVSAAKGFEENSLLRMSTVLEETLPKKFRRRITVLSGPNHAEEVSRLLPAASVAASRSETIARTVSDALLTDRFRVYTNTDLIGVETGGALKNVIALGAGIADGLMLGDNARAALVTRGVVEITRLGVAMGGKARTFTGLSGLGDLFVTCSSTHSRNRAVGIKLGQGESLDHILSGMRTVAEGIKTTAAAKRLAEQYKVEMPITEEIYRVLFEKKPAAEALQALMTRRSKAELEEDIAFRG